MAAKNRRKLCLNCDGMVDLDVIVCPYCGNDMTKVVENFKTSSQESLTALYPPPYKPKDIETSNPTAEPKEDKKSSVIPAFIFSIGINICLFGLYLLLFSTKGEIFLHFNATIWFVYVLLGSPLAFFGYKMLSKDSSS